MQHVFERLLAALLLAVAMAHAVPVSAQTTPTLLGAVSRKAHGSAGAFDLALNNLASNPTTEPRLGPAHAVVFTFDGTVTAGTATITEGTATAGVPTFNGAELTVPLTGVNNAQYVTIAVSNVSTSGGGTGGSGSIRVGLLAGDVNQSRVVTIADLGLVNAALAQGVTAANFLKDVNASGTLTVADKGLTNARLTQALPAPGDAAPTVVSTVPTNNATGVASGANVTIQFSEPVTVSGSWFQIACTNGTRTPANTAVSGDLSATSGTTFTLNPNAPFTFGDVCVATLFANGIGDNDALDPPDHPPADFIFTFTVSAGNAVPVVRNDSAATQPGAAVQFNVLANDNDPDLDSLVVVSSGQGANGSVVCLANGNCTYTPSAGFAGIDTFTYTVGDGQGGTASGSVVVTVLPADATLVAPPVDLSVATTVDRTAAFLWSGSTPVQTGVAPGTIQATRASILRGRVFNRNGTPLPGAIVTVLSNSQFGQSVSRANGAYDMAVNGARLLTLNFAAAGFLTAQRQVRVPWQGFVDVPDVALVPLDAQVTSITANAGTMQVHQGSLVSDADGNRKATVLFPAGTTATLVFPDGSTQPLSTLSVRATEFTVGPNGLMAMPAQLPPTSAYTYAVELSVDQAIAAGANSVTFSQPVPTYVDNFLNFATGMAVPAGYYDMIAGQWVRLPDGRVIKILSITGNVADLDVTGDGIADTGAVLTNLGITPAEQQQLALLYAPGKSLWRVPLAHFTRMDFNWPFVLPPDATGPAEGGAGTSPELPEQDACEAAGSIIECENQVLGERVGIVGTPYSLNYRSDRVPGRLSVLNVKLSDARLPPSTQRIELRANFGGQIQTASFAPAPFLKHVLYANHKDVYGRIVQGGQVIETRIEYVYGGQYTLPSGAPAGSFGSVGSGVTVNPVRQAGTVGLVQSFESIVGEGITDARAFGLGGWMLDVHHFYDFIGRTLHTGDGGRSRAEALGNSITTIAGTGVTGIAGNGIPALQATIEPAGGMAIGPDGTIYFCNYSGAALQFSLVRRVSASGFIATVAGSPSASGFNGDNILAANAHLTCLDLAVGPDFSVYVMDLANRRVRRIRPNNTITTVAGNGTNALGQEGVVATSTSIVPNRIALGPDGSLYIGENTGSVTFGASLSRIRRVATDGIITTVLTCATSNCGLTGLAVGNDGSVYYVDRPNSAPGGARIKRLRPDGATVVVAGSGTCVFGADGIVNGLPAVQAKLCDVFGLTLRPDGTLHFADSNSSAIAAVSPDGILSIFAGKASGSLADGIPARDATLDTIDIKVGFDGATYLSTRAQNGGVGPDNAHIRRINAALPGFANTAFIVADRRGREVHSFDAQGRHLNTRHNLTGSVLREFAYDAAGRLSTVTEKTGATDNVTTIQRDGNGNPTKIVGPYGQQTLLAADANGFLAQITNPAGEATTIASSTEGLLQSFTDPRGKSSQYSYDGVGRLIHAADPGGGTQTLVRTTNDNGYVVTRTTALGRVTTHKVESLAGGEHLRTVILPGGETTTLRAKSDGSYEYTRADGTVITATTGADPRFGLQVPFAKSSTTTTPNGLARTTSVTAAATLSNTADPFSLVGLAQQVTTDLGTTSRNYNATTRTQVTTSPAGRIATIVIDSLGRLASSQAAGIEPGSMTYDSRGRLATLLMGTGAGARTLTYAYNPQGFVASITDPLGRVAQWAYDAAGRVTGKTSPDGSINTFAYDVAGHLASLTPPGHPAHGFSYSNRDEVTSYIPPAVPGSGPTGYAYDVDRAMTGIQRPDNRSVAFGYDAAGRNANRVLATNGVATATDTVAYDAVGRVASIASANGVTSVPAYDGLLVTGETTSGAINGTVTRVYDAVLRLASQSVNGANTIAFAYDNDERLTGIGGLAVARNAQNGLPTGSTLGTVTTVIGRNTFGEMTQYTANANGSPVYSFNLTRDALGRIAQRVETISGATATFVYSYDPVGQLTGVTKNGLAFESYVYDTNGNRTSATVQGLPVTASYNAQDRLTQYGGATYVYNAAGDLSTRTLGGQTTTYQYDQPGNLRSVTLPNATAIDYVIDGKDRRVGKKVNGVLAKGYLYNDALRPVAELDAAGNVKSRFVYGKAVAPVFMVNGGSNFRILTDHIGSVRLVVNTTTGAIAQRIDYDTFGNVIQDTNPGFQPFGFAGGIADTDTGLVRFGARDYDPPTGRWTAKDPIGFAGGSANLYRYAGNDPTNSFDPLGLTRYEIMAYLRDVIKTTTESLQKIVSDSRAAAKPYTGDAADEIRLRIDELKNMRQWAKQELDAMRRGDPNGGGQGRFNCLGTTLGVLQGIATATGIATVQEDAAENGYEPTVLDYLYKAAGAPVRSVREALEREFPSTYGSGPEII